MSNSDMFALITGLITSICGVIPTIVSVVILIRNTIKNKDWAVIVEIANAAMSKAEEKAREVPGMSGDDKLNYALEIIKGGLNAKNISFDTKTIEKIVAYIKEMCSWSKTVNK